MFLSPFETIFNNSFLNNVQRYSGTYRETGDGLIVSLDLPGMKKDEISIEVHSGILYISGKRKWGESSCDIERSYRLPDGLDATKVTAKYEDGVLEVMVPKYAEKQSRKILIQ